MENSVVDAARSTGKARRRFELGRSPLFVAIFCDSSVDALAQRAQAARWAGADGVCFELKNLPRGERSAQSLRRLMDATPLPAMCCLYRSDSLPSLTV